MLDGLWARLLDVLTRKLPGAIIDNWVRPCRLLALEGDHLKNTLVVITADHGEAHGERGFEGHARNVYPETTEIPWILAFRSACSPAS